MITLSDEHKEIYKRATELWGVDFLRGIIHEEIGEYLVAENHFFNRKRGPIDDVTEELADVLVCMFQLVTVLGEDKVKIVMDYKMTRLAERVVKADPQWKEGIVFKE